MSKESRREVTLSDGRVLTVDLSTMTWPEVRDMTRGAPLDKDAKKDNANMLHHAGLLARAVSLSADDVLALTYEDWSRLSVAVFGVVQNPLGSDPN